MRWLDDLRRARALYREDKDRHIGDIAVLKGDAFGLDVRPELSAALDPVRGWQPEIDLERLAAMPEGSFGRAYAEFIARHKLSLFVLTDAIDPETRARNAYGIRMALTHDLFHVLLGFDTSWIGEMGVLAFSVGQGYNRNLWVQASFAWLLYPLWSGGKLAGLAAAWRRGIEAGKRAPFLLGLRLEERFAEDLTQIRAELGLSR